MADILVDEQSEPVTPGVAGEQVLWMDSTSKLLTAKKSDGTKIAYGGAGPVVGYIPTLANVQNTAAETDFLTISFPANEMADGDVLEVFMGNLVKNNKGSNGTGTVKFYWGSASATLKNASVWGTSASEFHRMVRVSFMRVGTELWAFQTTGAENPWNLDTSVPMENSVFQKITGVTFTSTNSFKLSLTLSAANVDFYLKPQFARVYRLKAS